MLKLIYRNNIFGKKKGETGFRNLIFDFFSDMYEDY